LNYLNIKAVKNTIVPFTKPNLTSIHVFPSKEMHVSKNKHSKLRISWLYPFTFTIVFTDEESLGCMYDL